MSPRRNRRGSPSPQAARRHRLRFPRRPRYRRGQGRGRRYRQQIERHGDAKIDRGPDQARLAPAERMLHPGGCRPAHRAGEPGDQRDPGDRTPRLAAIEPSQRREGRVVESHRHADTEHDPGGRQARRCPAPTRAKRARRPARHSRRPARRVRRAGRSSLRYKGAVAADSSSAPENRPKNRVGATPSAAAIGAPRIAGR